MCVCARAKQKHPERGRPRWRARPDLANAEEAFEGRELSRRAYGTYECRDAEVYVLDEAAHVVVEGYEEAAALGQACDDAVR